MWGPCSPTITAKSIIIIKKNPPQLKEWCIANGEKQSDGMRQSGRWIRGREGWRHTEKLPPFLFGLGHMDGAQRKLLTQQKSSLGTGEARRSGQNNVRHGGIELRNREILSPGIKIQLQSNVYIAPPERFKCKLLFAWRGCNDMWACVGRGSTVQQVVTINMV